MTEEEMKTKWCPHARVAGTFDADGDIGFTASNRFGSPFYKAPFELREATRCIGSDCAMWEKHQEGILLSYKTSAADIITDRVYAGENEGYCGLIK